MKLLLDESVPKRLSSFFPGEFEVHTVKQMGWTGSSADFWLSREAKYREDIKR